MTNKTKGAKGSKVTKSTAKTKGNKATTKPVEIAKVPNLEGGLLMRAAELPTKVAEKIGSLETVKGASAMITHLGAIQVRTGWGKPQDLAVKAIVKLLADGHSVLAANTCRYLTEKSMRKRVDQDGIKKVIVVAK